MERVAEVSMDSSNKATLFVFVLGLIMLYGCQDLVPIDTRSLLIPSLRRSELFGFLAGFGTTFAALPDLIAMLRHQSTAGMNPRMAAIMGAFQILWVYYGLYAPLLYPTNQVPIPDSTCAFHARGLEWPADGTAAGL